MIYLLDSDNPLKSVSDPAIQALMIDERMQFDPYLRQHITNSLNKKIRETYIGSLYLPGNYSVMISDPYAMMEHCLGLPIIGLLKEFEHYNNYWNRKNINRVVACRAPLTYLSEVNVLNLKNTEEMNYWYKYLYTGTIYNCHGNDVLLHADSDFDSDLSFTSSSQEMIDGAQGGLPISYAKKVAPKIEVNQENLVLSHINGLNSKIGFITNCSSTDYTMQVYFSGSSLEYKELMRRSKLFRYYQGENIDKSKNGGAKDMPKTWFNYQKIEDGMSKEQVSKIKFDNSILIDRRPYFFRFIYRHYNKRYLREIEVYDNYCKTKFGFGFKGLLAMPESEINDEMLQMKHDYYRYSYFIFTPSVMNKICWYMENKVKEYKHKLKEDIFDWRILVIGELDKNKIEQMKLLVEKYNDYKFKTIENKEDEDCLDVDMFNSQLKENALSQISSNIKELASLAIYCTYASKRGAKDFAWKLFGEGIVQNLLEKSVDKKIYIPVLDESGNQNYLWSHYLIKEFEIIEE